MIFTPLASISEKTKGKSKKNVLKSHIIINHKINQKWQKVYDKEYDIYDLKKEYNAIKIEDGYFPTNLTEDDIRDIDINKEIYFKVGRYDLIAWYPIE